MYNTFLVSLVLSGAFSLQQGYSYPGLVFYPAPYEPGYKVKYGVVLVFADLFLTIKLCFHGEQ